MLLKWGKIITLNLPLKKIENENDGCKLKCLKKKPS